MTASSDLVRAGLRHWPSGVTVVTTQLPAQPPIGLTVSSFNSVSLEPPLLLICVYKEAELAKAILESQVFGISILSHQQAHLSVRFAGFDPKYPKGSDRFDDLSLRQLTSGVPLLADALAAFDCRLWAQHDGSTHYIFVGEVLDVFSTPDDGSTPPLVYYNRGYHDLVSQS